jgi:hypothetical protein
MENNFSMPAVAWTTLTLLCLVLILAGLRAALRRTVLDNKRQQKIFNSATAIIASWTILLLLLAQNGFFADFSKVPPRPALAVLIPLPFIFLFAFSKTGTQLIHSIPPQWLVLMQSFRIAVELLLLAAYTGGKLPIQMTFEGMNFDVISGLLALPVGYLVARKKTWEQKAGDRI